MKIIIEDDVPIPTGRSSGSREQSVISETLCSLKKGQSFFIPALDCTPSVLQRRINVRTVQFRQSGKIDFFVRTMQTSGTYMDDGGQVVGPVAGVRVWHRPQDVDE